MKIKISGLSTKCLLDQYEYYVGRVHEGWASEETKDNVNKYRHEIVSRMLKKHRNTNKKYNKGMDSWI